MANTLLESASMGRPLITSNIHGCKEAVNCNGYLVSSKNSDELYKSIFDFVRLSYERKKELGIHSREHMETTFDKSIIVERTLMELNI